MKPLKIKALDDKNIPYEIIRNNNKNFRLKINDLGNVKIVFPYLTKESSLITFVEKHISWIEEKRAEILLKQVSYVQDSVHFIYGEKCTLKINYSKTTRVDKVGNIVMISTPNQNKIREIFLEWRKNTAELVFKEILYKCFSNMQDYLKKYPELTIKTSKTKWGCCYINQNKIMLNLALTQVPFNLIEYVVYHELVHFLVKDHSKIFHLTLQRFVPDERQLSKELKTYTNRI